VADMNKTVILLLLGIILIIVVILLILMLGSKTGKKTTEEDEPAANAINYSQYKYSTEDYIKYYMGGSVIAFILAQIFYDNIILGLVVVGVYLIVITYWKKIIINNIIKKRKDKLLLQFKDALQAIVAELSAGISFSNIIKSGKIIENLTLLHGDDSYIVDEFKRMAQALNHKVPEEEVLRDFADRAGIEDISNFVDVFTICRRQGGDINTVARNTANVIIEKINIIEEIQTVISQKKQEQKIMTILPIGMVLALKVMAPDYMEPLYTTFAGRIAMTIAVIIILIAQFTARKIMDIEV